MDFFEFILFDLICFIIKLIFVFIIYKIYLRKKKDDFMTKFDFGDFSDKPSISDIDFHFNEQDNSQDFVNEEKL